MTGRDPLTGRMDNRQAGVGGGSGVQNLAYLYDVNDNLSQRGDANQAGTCSVGGIGSKLCETFTYDSLDRLDTVRRNGTLALDANYDLSGNLSSRSDVGSYTYHATKKPAVTAAGSNSFAYDANGNVITRNGATLGWASYDLPTSLASGGNSVSFAYGPDRSRWRQIAVTAGVTETTIYVAGILEKVTKPSVTLWKHYVAAPTGMGAVYVRRSDGTSDTYYLTTDQLGSTDRILKAATGTVQVAESFDAFGKRRGSDWQGGPSAADLTAIGNSTPDGFTGHEMLDGVGLIHMGGRVYDPTVGRFLSVDPVVRDATSSQSWNGYGYVEGRLLSATDPSGLVQTVFVSGRRLKEGVRELTNPADIRMYLDMWRGGGEFAGSSCAQGMEEVVVDGQRGQPSVSAVTLTFMPVSISPPNLRRIAGLLNAAEAEFTSCVTTCRSATGHVTQTLAGIAGGAVTGAAASRTVPGLFAGAVVGGSVALATSFLPQNPVSLAYGGAAIGAVGAYAEVRHRGGATGPGAIGGAIGEAVGGAIGGRDGAVIGGTSGGIVGSILAARAAGVRGVAVMGIGFSGAVAGAAGGVAYSVALQRFNTAAEWYCEATCGR